VVVVNGPTILNRTYNTSIVTLQVRLFNHLQIQSDRPATDSVLRPRAQRLLVYLLLHRKNPIPRKNLAFTLWPDMTEPESLGMLRRALSDLRTSLPDGEGWVLTTRDRINWNSSASVWLDAEVFEDQIHKADSESLLQAIELYTGDLLRDMDEEWLIPERERYRQMQFEALRKLARHYRSQQSYSAALEYTRRALLLDPLSESVYQDRIKLLFFAGGRAAALAEYERLKALFEEELGVEPMEETRALVEAVIRGELPRPMPEKLPNKTLDLSILPKLVGRQSETAKLIEHWDNAMQGKGSLVIVSGEAGVGKSHLVKNFAQQVSHKGGLPIIGYCYEFENTLPHQPILEMIRQAAHLIKASALSSIHRAALAHLLPDIFEPDDSTHLSLSPDDLRVQLYEAVFQAFCTVSQHRPVLLLIEDIHWASESLLDWLTLITPRLQGNRPLVLITYRTEEVKMQHAVPRLVRRFEREGIVTSIALRRFSREHNREWVTYLSGLDQKTAAPIADRLYNETAGNPFFLQEIIRGMTESGQIRVEAGQWSGALVQGAAEMDVPLPESLRETILARVERLTEMSRTFVQAAVVAGRAFPYEIVYRAGGWREEASLSALEDLITRGFLREGTSKGSFTFVHHLMQEAIYSELTVPRRVYWHRRLAETIEALHPEEYELIAYHFIAAGERNLGIKYSHQAAQRAELLYAYEDACRHLRIALDLLETGQIIELRLTLLESLGDNYRLLRQGDQAISAYQSALEIWQNLGSSEKMAGVRLYRKILQTTAGIWETTDFQEIESASRISRILRAKVDALLQTLEGELPNKEVVHLLRQLAVDSLIYRFPVEWDKALEYAQSAVKMAEQLNEPVELASALTTLAHVYGANGFLRERAQAALRALSVSREHHFGDLRERVLVLIGVGKALIDVGEYEQSIPYLEEAEKLADRIHAVHEQTQALSLIEQSWFRLDRWDEMLEVEEKRRILQQTYPLRQVGTPCFAIGLCAAVHALRGEHEVAQILHQESFEIMSAVSGSPENWKRSHRY
jgi:DNA-binding SARP family transcriptional activator